MMAIFITFGSVFAKSDAEDIVKDRKITEKYSEKELNEKASKAGNCSITWHAVEEFGDLQGNRIVFKVVAGRCPSTLTDIDGNIYKTVQLGEQCWMAENLRTTRYADGTSIPLGTTYSYDEAYRYCPNNNSSNVSSYGYLYNWKAVMGSSSSSSANPSGVQGICPTGWHVPSNAEWTQLIIWVGSQSSYQCSSSSENIAKALASTYGWESSTNSCAVGNNPSSNNATGFSAPPAGYYGGDYGYFGYSASFWSAAELYSSYAYYRHLGYNNANVYSRYGTKYDGFSVRCVRD